MTSAAQVATVRRFNRRYTEVLGILDDGWLGGAYSLAAVRVMFEIANGERSAAKDIGERLRLDRGYLSRILASLERDGLVAKEPSPDDARQRLLTLTKKGRRVFADLDARQSADVGAILERLAPGDRTTLVAAMRTCLNVLRTEDDGAKAARPSFELRAPKVGDLGWIVERHAALYAEEHGFGMRFEGLVASVVGDFAANADPKYERCWIAEHEGRRLGSIMVTRGKGKPGAQGAKLRLLLVEPSARGTGLGTRLVAESIAFATRVGYAKMQLWTAHVLAPARRIYERAGFRMVHEAPSDLFLPARVNEQTWELPLGALD